MAKKDEGESNEMFYIDEFGEKSDDWLCAELLGEDVESFPSWQERERKRATLARKNAKSTA